MTNAPFILNLDCDMYSNDADTIREILCFFLDEKKGDEVAFVQFPQHYDNMTRNDVYANVNHATNEVSNKYDKNNNFLCQLSSLISQATRSARLFDHVVPNIFFGFSSLY